MIEGESCRRLSNIKNASLTESDKTSLNNLLKEEKILSGLADLKCDTKDFKARMISAEREKMLCIKPLYQLAKALLPKLKLSQKNREYYADLVHYYTIHDLRKRIKSEQAYLYLLCYLWQRYRQLKDNKRVTTSLRIIDFLSLIPLANVTTVICAPIAHVIGASLALPNCAPLLVWMALRSPKIFKPRFACLKIRPLSGTTRPRLRLSLARSA
jgi:hypothetical protein